MTPEQGSKIKKFIKAFNEMAASLDHKEVVTIRLMKNKSQYHQDIHIYLDCEIKEVSHSRNELTTIKAIE